ncbi:MAG: Mannosylfructose-phosphate synthase [Planctomycetes bacterium ADurb.Bin126]|nr:MAG: Mannosylfructose-phosphate synthase [Planctomycetes bacterium ADurb.Bin126]HQL74046.1 glycosyltransferase [Phycisphaerae bacterium]
MAVTVSVILVTHDRPASLSRAVRSVLAQSRPAAQVVIVNDGDHEVSPDLLDEIERSPSALRTVHQDRPCLPAARNAGLAAAEADVLLLLDDDHELPRDYLARLAGLYEADPEGAVDAISGLVVEPGRARPSRLWRTMMRAAGHLRWRPRRCVARSRPLPEALQGRLVATRYLTGGATSMRRAMARSIGYDEGLGGYALGEDREFSYRATRRFAIYQAPGLLMVHHGEPSQRPDDRTYGRMIVRNYLRLASRAIEEGCGKWVAVGWNLAGLALAHAAFAIGGRRRRYHWDVLCGMAAQAIAECGLRIAEFGWRVADLRASFNPQSAFRHTQSPRVLLLLSRFDSGGAERIALDLMGRLGERGAAVGAAAMYGGGQWSDRFARAAAFCCDGLARGRWDAWSIARTARLIHRERVDAVVIVDAVKNAMLAGMWGAALSGRAVRLLLWCHACPGHQLSGRMGGFVGRLRRTAGRLDRIVCVAAWQRRELERLGVAGEKMTVISNGVDLERFGRRHDEDARTGALRTRRELGLPQEAFVLVQVANYWPEKDPAWLLDAMAMVTGGGEVCSAAVGRPQTANDQEAADASAGKAHGKPSVGFQHGTHLHLALVGRGMDSPAVKQAIAARGLEDAVTPAGYRDDVPAWLGAADAFVLASAHETQSLAAMEAMAAGLPVIVADIPGFGDLVEHERTGLKCRPGDADDLADCIRRLAGDRQLCGRLAAAARDVAQDWDVRLAADRWLAVLGDAGIPARD